MNEGKITHLKFKIKKDAPLLKHLFKYKTNPNKFLVQIETNSK